MWRVNVLEGAFNQEMALVGASSVTVTTSPMVCLQLYSSNPCHAGLGMPATCGNNWHHSATFYITAIIDWKIRERSQCAWLFLEPSLFSLIFWVTNRYSKYCRRRDGKEGICSWFYFIFYTHLYWMCTLVRFTVRKLVSRKYWKQPGALPQTLDTQHSHRTDEAKMFFLFEMATILL